MLNARGKFNFGKWVALNWTDNYIRDVDVKRVVLSVIIIIGLGQSFDSCYLPFLTRVKGIANQLSILLLKFEPLHICNYLRIR